MDARLPNGYDAGRFAVENAFYELPFGFHGIDKGFVPLTVQEKIVRQIEF